MQQQQTKKTHKPTNYFSASFKKNKKTKNKIFANGGKKYKKKYIFLHDIKNVF